MRFKNSSIDFFPLVKAHSALTGYYMTAGGEIYSTRQSAAPVKLHGSKANSWSNRYFSLGGTSWEHNKIIRHAKAHKEFTKEASPAPGTAYVTTEDAIAAKVKGQLPDRNHAESLSAGIQAKGSIIGKVENGVLTVNPSAKVHLTAKSLESEMMRLALLSPGVQYIALNIGKTLTSGGLVWK